MNKHEPTCQDCYFRRQGLCALVVERPCPTFRAAGRILQPPLVARPTLAATALPQAAYAV
jgi:hypothetical protein